jgi:hypothetical protein
MSETPLLPGPEPSRPRLGLPAPSAPASVPPPAGPAATAAPASPPPVRPIVVSATPAREPKPQPGLTAAANPSNRLSSQQWMMMGFAVGMACGALVLIRYQMAAPLQALNRSPATVQGASPKQPSAPVRAPSGVYEPVEDKGVPVAVSPPDSEQQELQDELQRLRREVEKRRLQAELRTLQQELTTLDEPPVTQPVSVPQRAEPLPETPAVAAPAAAPVAETPPNEPDRGAATLAFWNRMNDVIAQEAVMRTVPSGGLTAASAGEFLNRRIAAAKFAAGALKELDRKDVDPLVAEFARTLAEWYAAGATVNEEGQRLLAQEAEARRGPAGVRWQTTYKQHEQRVEEINASGARVRDAMQKKYGLEFPPLR